MALSLSTCTLTIVRALGIDCRLFLNASRRIGAVLSNLVRCIRMLIYSPRKVANVRF